ncbi:hypothetical protein FNF31_03006 [Cafeteria roenbergensis]|uniref:Uncharacterized protein n=1 Tax=Cafeteria roenbergensis TaxID=33653 RepID=A0A5A8DFF1_CAFRO|nr:hypothetical protein FNF31_03006 [Cafeteria roenbergensis]
MSAAPAAAEAAAAVICRDVLRPSDNLAAQLKEALCGAGPLACEGAALMAVAASGDVLATAGGIAELTMAGLRTALIALDDGETSPSEWSDPLSLWFAIRSLTGQAELLLLATATAGKPQRSIDLPWRDLVVAMAHRQTAFASGRQRVRHSLAAILRSAAASEGWSKRGFSPAGLAAKVAARRAAGSDPAPDPDAWAPLPEEPDAALCLLVTSLRSAVATVAQAAGVAAHVVRAVREALAADLAAPSAAAAAHAGSALARPFAGAGHAANERGPAGWAGYRAAMQAHLDSSSGAMPPSNPSGQWEPSMGSSPPLPPCALPALVGPKAGLVAVLMAASVSAGRFSPYAHRLVSGVEAWCRSAPAAGRLWACRSGMLRLLMRVAVRRAVAEEAKAAADCAEGAPAPTPAAPAADGSAAEDAVGAPEGATEGLPPSDAPEWWERDASWGSRATAAPSASSSSTTAAPAAASPAAATQAAAASPAAADSPAAAAPAVAVAGDGGDEAAGGMPLFLPALASADGDGDADAGDRPHGQHFGPTGVALQLALDGAAELLRTSPLSVAMLCDGRVLSDSALRRVVRLAISRPVDGAIFVRSLAMEAFWPAVVEAPVAADTVWWTMDSALAAERDASPGARVSGGLRVHPYDPSIARGMRRLKVIAHLEAALPIASALLVAAVPGLAAVGRDTVCALSASLVVWAPVALLAGRASLRRLLARCARAADVLVKRRVIPAGRLRAWAGQASLPFAVVTPASLEAETASGSSFAAELLRSAGSASCAGHHAPQRVFHATAAAAAACSCGALIRRAEPAAEHAPDEEAPAEASGPFQVSSASLPLPPAICDEDVARGPAGICFGDDGLGEGPDSPAPVAFGDEGRCFLGCVVGQTHAWRSHYDARPGERPSMAKTSGFGYWQWLELLAAIDEAAVSLLASEPSSKS